jgi:hypothetical protein
VLRTSAAYFVGISVLAPKTQRFITFAGSEVNDQTLQSLDFAQNITEAIPVFMDLELKDLKSAIYLHKSFYWNRHRPYWAMPLEFR